VIELDLKALLRRLNQPCRKALESAAGMCMSRGNYEVTLEHMLLVLADSSDQDVPLILRHFGIDPARMRKALTRAVEGLRGGNAGRPVFSPILLEWIQDAWLVASVELGLGEVRSGALLAALAFNKARYGSDEIQDLLEAIDPAELRRDFADIVAGSSEEATRLDVSRAAAGSAAGGGAAGERSADSALARFCVDLTARARAGEIDPVFGREREIRQIVNILGRRRKNNPICVGEAGVGKSAVVEGLARKIVGGDVPDFLENVDLLTLDLQLLQAGASVKGEFEQRLKDVMEEVKASPKPVILFVDEVHTLIGAGGAQGTGDAANLIKPALARGEMRTIAATTFSEYKRYIDKDAALARRFQLVSLDEPSPEQTVTILRGLRSVYEEAHGVYVRDDAVSAAAQLAGRYLSGRQLPDKAIDVLDTASARVKLSVGTKPATIDDLEREIGVNERERAAVARDLDAKSGGDPARLAQLDELIAKQQAQLAEMTAAWESERDAVRRVLDLRQALARAERVAEEAEDAAAAAPALAAAGEGDGAAEAPAPEAAAPPETSGDPTALQQELDEAMAALNAIQDRSGMIHYEVSPLVVAQVISDWTGIPVGNMLRGDKDAIMAFGERLRGRIKGQDHAVEALDKGMRTAKAGLQNPAAPLGVFLFVGPSGVGKTETALGIADLLFGGERFMTTINMSEFQEKHTVSRLIGSPPGYVGYGEGGRLTEAVRQRPYSVVLLDEVEKADLEVMNLFYQVFDKGQLADGEGRIVDFKNTVMVLTSNLASDIITEMGGGEEPAPLEAVTEAIRPVLSNHFRPALLARMQVVPFLPIGANIMRDIVQLKLARVAERLAQRHNMQLAYADAVVDQITRRCTEVETGARNVDHIVNSTLLPEISSRLLEMLDAESMPGNLTVDLHEDGHFAYHFH